MSEKRNEINTFANYQNVIVKNSSTFNRLVFCSFFQTATSSPGSSRFLIWRRQERRPWDKADHVIKISNEVGD